ncbi:MAG TPA: TonB-dependent receptor [Chitinophagaceae bacterium]
MKKIEASPVFYRELLSPKLFRIMKLTMLFLTIACLQVSAKTFSQDKISLRMKTAELKKVLFAIEKNSSYRFLFDEDVIKGKALVSIEVKDAGINDVLSLIFANTGISYRILNTNLVVLKEAADPSEITVKELTVTGKVSSASGEALFGVSVNVKGSTVGTTTDANGNYSLTVPDNAVLVFSSVGFVTAEETVAGRTVINITLQVSTQVLDQVVVVGYGTQRKRDLTGSISSVKGEELAKMPATNPMSSMQGKVPGLTVVNSGRAGASPTVRIRGVNSTNNSDPLYVVDGVFQTNIDYLNPADIENIEILRDPSSIAIFGLQGGNGVIIVTTKRAAKGETRVSFQSNVGVQKVTNKIDVTDAEGFKKLHSAQLANLNAAAFDYSRYTANTDWQDLIFRDALINSNTVTVSNSGEKTVSLFSLGYNVQEGVLKNDKFQKFIARLNHEIRVSKGIKIGGDITGFHWSQNEPGADLNNALWAAPIVPVQVDEKTYYSMPSFQRAQVGNPVARLNRFDNTAVNKGYRFIGSIFGEFKFKQYFTFRSSFYTDLGFNNSRSYSPLPFRFVNLGEGAAPTDTTYDASVKTSVSQAQAEFRKFQQDHTLTFEKTFNKKHRVTALAGFTTLFQGSSNVSGTRRDTTLNIPDDPDYWYINIVNANNPTTNAGSGGEESYMSFLGRINYSLSGKYLVNATFRRDGSSKFSPENRWGNFGSVGVGWVITSEDFFHVKFINFLKLRGAWGTVGSGLGLPANLYLPGLTTANVGVFGDNVYGSVAPAYVPDPNLHWEVVRGIDIGLDLRALNNRLSTEITFYDRTTKDILTTLTLPGTAGNYSYRTNLGTITNRGVEISAGWSDRIGKDFTYNIGANFSYNKNEVESIGNNINFEILGNAGVNKTVTGESIGYFYGYRQIGIYQSVADLDKIPGLSNSLPGDVAYADVDGNGIIDSKDRTYLGTPFPIYNIGANISLGYKGFDLILEGQGVAGNKVYTQRRTATFAVLNYEANRLNAWTTPGSTNIEPILDNTRGNNFLFSSYYLEPGDYFRIRTLQLGYTFSSRTLGNGPVKQLRLYISGQNIATFSKTTGYTPEASLSNPIASGADNGTYPVPAVYSFGVNVTF